MYAMIQLYLLSHLIKSNQTKWDICVYCKCAWMYAYHNVHAYSLSSWCRKERQHLPVDKYKWPSLQCCERQLCNGSRLKTMLSKTASHAKCGLWTAPVQSRWLCLEQWMTSQMGWQCCPLINNLCRGNSLIVAQCSTEYSLPQQPPPPQRLGIGLHQHPSRQFITETATPNHAIHNLVS